VRLDEWDTRLLSIAATMDQLESGCC
jgi:hypothetical protein